MRFLVVDDEHSICDRTAERIRLIGDARISSVNCAYSGEEALELLRQSTFDVLITDICMTGMDGLELIRLAKRELPSLLCVIISAYNQFEYAKRGIQLGVCDFWVKPYSVQNMRESVEQILRRLADGKEQKHYQLDLMLNEAVLTGSRAAAEIFAENAMLLPYDGLALVTWRKPLAGQLAVDNLSIYQPNGKPYLFLNCELDNHAAWEEALVQLCSVLRQPAGVSLPNRNPKDMYRQAVRMLDYDWVWEQDYPYQYLEEVENKQEREIARRIAKMAMGYSVEQILGELDSTRSRVGNSTFCEIVSAVRQALIEQTREMCAGIKIELLSGHGDPHPKSGWRTVLGQMLLEVQQIKKYRLSLAQKDPVKWAKEHAADHMREGVDMAVVANQLNMSYQYFSKIFREQAGLPFSEYVLELRMKEACRLLMEGESISSIAEQIGYRNTNNFSRAFKKMYGISPKAFRTHRTNGV